MGFDKISELGKHLYKNDSKSIMDSQLPEHTNTEKTSTFNTRKRLKRTSLLPGLALIAGLYIGASILAWLGYLSNNNEQFDLEATRIRRQASRNVLTNTTTSPVVTSLGDDVTTVGVNLSETKASSQGIYPTDLFDLETRKRGAVVLHVIGMLYMFIALAVVCDEFFVPALEVIIRRLQISDDVAGATFMAAGGSAPELFTSIIGVFLAKSNVGIGTIVGSAVFNILFVIGMCSLFSHEILSLTWWPLFRDCMFYIISLIALIVSFSDATIQYYECIVMISVYIFYVAFMKYNGPIEVWVKGKINSTVSVTSSNNTSKSNGKSSKSVRAIENSINRPSDPQHGKSTFSYGIVQLMMNTLDPATDESTQAKSSRLYAIARMKLISPQAARTLSTQPSGDRDNRTDVNEVDTNGTHATVIYENEGVKVAPQNNTASNHPSIVQNMPSNGRENTEFENNKVGYQRNKTDNENSTTEVEVAMKNDQPKNKKFDEESMNDMNETLDLRWPKSCTKRLVYILLAPIMLSLWVTMPDVRNPKREKYFMFSFFGSIVWIAVFSYLMVWLAHQVGETVGLSEAVMGLTFLAAGTSVPDLITSVIVARKGLGDMAVSSSVGSNIFDVTIGLPLPWLIYSITQMGAPIVVESKGLFCSVLLLFIMLLLVVGSIAASHWRMNKGLGLSMLALYAVFLTFSLLLEFSIIGCPVGGS